MTTLHQTSRFLKGPIPMQWLNVAGRLPGKALHAAIVIWHLAGLMKSHEIGFSYKLLADIGVGRHSGYKALRDLEQAELISCVRHSGRCPIVTILKGF